jgi:hypothetical protein
MIPEDKYSAGAEPFWEDSSDAESGEDNVLDASQGAEKAFPKVTRFTEERGTAVFDDPGYYKSVLAGEGQAAQRLHMLIQQYFNTKDGKAKNLYRQQLIDGYWDFLAGVCMKAGLSEQKKYLLRFGMVYPNFVDAGDRDFFSRIIDQNYLRQPVYYLDEWLRAVADGTVGNSGSDEVRIAHGDTQGRLQQLLKKAKGKREGSRGLLFEKLEERSRLEKTFLRNAEYVCGHNPVQGFATILSCYTEEQKKAFQSIHEIMRNLIVSDRDLEAYMRDFFQAEKDVKTLESKTVSGAEAPAEEDRGLASVEFDTIRQMAKLTVGRQGNHFPFLCKEFFHLNPDNVAYRENVIFLLSKIEAIDVDVFYRSFKGRRRRIVPNILLLPSFGDVGICWEPYERFNRATSRGRLVLPMYPKNLTQAILYALGDLHWQAAKERASYYWMEEGLTGNYYQCFAAKKLKGDPKDFFIQDYITWISKESEGVQRLDKDVRGVFWRYVPFSQAVKKKLRDRSPVFQELYQRDQAAQPWT